MYIDPEIDAALTALSTTSKNRTTTAANTKDDVVDHTTKITRTHISITCFGASTIKAMIPAGNLTSWSLEQDQTMAGTLHPKTGKRLPPARKDCDCHFVNHHVGGWVPGPDGGKKIFQFFVDGDVGGRDVRDFEFACERQGILTEDQEQVVRRRPSWIQTTTFATEWMRVRV